MTNNLYTIYDIDGRKALRATQAAVRKSKETEVLELEAWSKHPNKFPAYHDAKQGIVTTWLGTKMGTVLRRTCYRSNMAQTSHNNMTYLLVEGTNGGFYYGRYGHYSGNLVTLRIVKEL